MQVLHRITVQIIHNTTTLALTLSTTSKTILLCRHCADMVHGFSLHFMSKNIMIDILVHNIMCKCIYMYFYYIIWFFFYSNKTFFFKHNDQFVIILPILAIQTIYRLLSCFLLLYDVVYLRRFHNFKTIVVDIGNNNIIFINYYSLNFQKKKINK